MGNLESRVLSSFSRLFGAGEAPRLFFAPGRVNLIGEHTDYNGGHVFPCALTLGIVCAARLRDDRRLRMYSLNAPDDGVVETTLDRDRPLPGGSWANYPLGVVRAFTEAGFPPERGLELVFCGDIPAGAGLSSSAALEVLTGTALRALFRLPVAPAEIAQLGQRAENRFVGVNCGIMDQFASAMGKRGHAIFLDTASLRYEYAPLPLEHARIVIANSRVRHSLAGSAYNERRGQCARALEELQAVLPVRSLGELTPEQFDGAADRIQDPVCRRRARHAVYENARTVQAVQALRQGDLARFGRLMNDSHVSLRDDYEVSCRELDALAEIAWACPGVFGSRMTGGGFGGCTVSIVADGAAERLAETLREEYRRRTGLETEVYTVLAGDGAHELTGAEDAPLR